MPNEANKSKDKSGIEQKKRKPTMPPTESHDKDGNAAKKSNTSKAGKGNAESSTSAKSKKASGENGDD